jgi:hypothetical protein
VSKTATRIKKVGPVVVPVSHPEVSRMGDPVPPLFFLRDPDGNTLMVIQSS